MPDVTDLPRLDEPHDLDADTIDRFRRDGHTLVPGLASPAELEPFVEPISRAAIDHAWDARPIEERDTYGKAFLQSFNLWRHSPVLEAFTFSRRFARAAAELMGVGGVRLYHDQALFKEPGGGLTPWHQDQHYWPLATDHAVTMWMPLRDITAEVGTMTFVPGSHRMGNLAGGHISDESNAALSARVASEGWATVTYSAVRAGDATFHAGWTLHSAGPNPTDTMRPVMTVIYVADDATVAEPENDSQRLDLSVWLPGLAPGDPVASPINPRLWP